MLKIHALPLWCLLCLLAAGCATKTVKTTTFTPLNVSEQTVPEEELLDVGIALFDPGLEGLSRREAELTFADVRRAETFYTANLLSQTLQSSGNWGVVRVIPGDLSSSDVAVQGTLLQSDGETMRVKVEVRDATGRHWFTREYEEVVSRYSYDPRLRRTEDAFQGLYNRIANDMLAYRERQLKRDELLAIRNVARLQFARSFAPDAYGQYLQQNRRGLWEIRQMPADNDPVMQRIESIRERDHLFVDTLQEHYSQFHRQMETPYTEFRKYSYEEILEYNKLRKEARRNMILGAAAIAGGLYAGTQGNSPASPWLMYGGIAAGAYLIRDAIYTSDEAKMHVEALAELGASLEAEIAPQTIELEERTITLTGNVESQYEQWRGILSEIYAEEIGSLDVVTQ